MSRDDDDDDDDDDHEEDTKEEPRGPAFFFLLLAVVLRDILTILCAAFEQPAVAVRADKTDIICACVLRDKKMIKIIITIRCRLLMFFFPQCCV